MRRIIKSDADNETLIVMYFESNFNFYSSDITEDQSDQLSQDISDLSYDYKMREMIDNDPDSQDLAEYLDKDLKGKITQIDLSWDSHYDRLKTVSHVAPGVDPNPLIDPLEDYLLGQMSDGWGEGFEQQEILSFEDYVVCNEEDDYFLEEYGTDWRSADRRADELNEEERSYHDDEDDEGEYDGDGGPYYSTCAHVSLYCSFWTTRTDHAQEIKVYVNGRDENGFDMTGYDAEGYDKYGYNKGGRDRGGFDRMGRDSEGYDKEGYNREGRDRQGFNKEGYRDMADTRPEYYGGKKQGGLFKVDKNGKVSIRNPFELGNSRKAIKSDYHDKEIYREAFGSLVKDSDAQDFDNSPYGTVHYPGFYRVLVDGTYETEFSAETDEEAIQKFKDYFANKKKGINNSKKPIKSSYNDSVKNYDLSISPVRNNGEKMLDVEDMVGEILQMAGIVEDAVIESEDYFRKRYEYYKNHPPAEEGHGDSYESDPLWMAAQRDVLNHLLSLLTDDAIDDFFGSGRIYDYTEEQQALFNEVVKSNGKQSYNSYDEDDYSYTDRYDFSMLRQSKNNSSKKPIKSSKQNIQNIQNILDDNDIPLVENYPYPMVDADEVPDWSQSVVTMKLWWKQNDIKLGWATVDGIYYYGFENMSDYEAEAYLDEYFESKNENDDDWSDLNASICVIYY